MKKKIAEFLILCIYNLASFSLIFTAVEKLREIKQNDEIKGTEKVKTLTLYGTGFVGSLVFLVAGADRIIKWTRR